MNANDVEVSVIDPKNLDIVEHLTRWALGEDVTAHYEAEADAFYCATGIMAPGKSEPMEMGGDDARLAERRKAWDDWCRQRHRAKNETVIALIAEAREAARLREELDAVTVVLNACNEPATYADGTEASVSDRIQSFGLRFSHAVLLASLADSKLRMDSTPVPRKEGDKMPVAMAWISRHFTEQIESVPEARNYVSWGWTDTETCKAYTVTVQRAEGKTPATIAAEAREEAARLRERVAELERAANAVIRCVDRGEVGTSARHDATNALRAALTSEPR